jgi:opacity protein-like surface antigen
MVAGLTLCLGAAAAPAQSNYYLPPDAGPYFRVGVGPAFFEDGQLTQFGGPVSSKVDFQTGLALNAAFGWDFNKYVAVDFETGLIGAKINNVPGFSSANSDLYNVPLLVNVTVSYPIPRTNVTPYVGAGVGGADVVFETDNFNDGVTTVTGSESDMVFAGQVFAGLRFQLYHRISLDLGYKYFATGNPTFSYPPSPNFDVGFRGARTHSVLFAFRFDF